MKRIVVWLGMLVLASVPAAAQGPAVVTGRIVSGGGKPEAAVVVRIEALNVGATSAADGAYRLEIPAARFTPGDSVRLSASRVGLAPASRTIVLHPDSVLVQDFTMAISELALDEFVVTGAAAAAAPEGYSARMAPPPPGAGGAGQGTGRAGVLTAGVLDDFGRGWGEYRRFLREEHENQAWGVDTWDVLRVRVRNGRRPLRDHPVVVEQDGRRFQARTDGAGILRVFPGMPHQRLREGTFTVTPEGGTPRQLAYRGRSARGARPLLDVNQRVEPVVRRPVLEIALMIDATGSMGDEMRYLQTELRDIIGRVQPLGAPFDVRIAVVYYRDRRDEFITRVHPFTDDVDATVAFLAATEAGGGGDFPEEMNAALRETMRLEWSDGPAARMVFVVADAPPREYPDAPYTYHDALGDASRRGIAIFPLASSGIDRPTEYLMRAMAVATGGKYVFLTDDSGVGNPHLTPETDFEVEPLNDLMVREIRAYAASRFPQVRELRGRVAARR